MRGLIKGKEEDNPFSCLMFNEKTNLIVLFYENEKGIVVSQGNSMHPIGEHLTCWNMNNFKLYNGIIELSNKRSK